METSLKTGFAQVFSCCPKNLSCPNFGGAAAPLAPPARTPMNICYLEYISRPEQPFIIFYTCTIDVNLTLTKVRIVSKRRNG